MSEKVIKIKRGLNINLVGSAEKVLTKSAASATYALVPDEFIGVVPKMLVKEGESVLIGTPLFFDKAHPEVLFTSPVAGTLKEVVRGEKRKILAVVVEVSGEQNSADFQKLGAEATKEQIKEQLLKAGYWPMLIQRPFGIIANAEDTPRDIFVSAFDSAPLGVDLNFILQDEVENINAGIEALKKLTSGDVHFTHSSDVTAGAFAKVSGAKIHKIEGVHPAGNVGVQIEAVKPIAKDEKVWTVDVVHLSMIGRLMRTGKADFSRTIAVAGACVKKPRYIKTIAGALVSSVCGDGINTSASKTGNVRYINGNPLSGRKIEADGYLGFYNNLLCVIPEGDYYEFAGWAMPRFKKFSTSRSYFSWLTPKRKFNIDTNLNGGERAFVANGIYEQVMPMNIYPVYLIKAVMAGDIDKMEQLGIYEVVEEDLALCEFICPSKIEWQSILRQGITKMIKEL